MSDQQRRNKILSDAVMDAIGAAVGVPVGTARRIVIDATVGQPVRVYIEHVGDTRLIDMELPHFGPGDFELIPPPKPESPDG